MELKKLCSSLKSYFKDKCLTANVFIRRKLQNERMSFQERSFMPLQLFGNGWATSSLTRQRIALRYKVCSQPKREPQPPSEEVQPTAQPCCQSHFPGLTTNIFVCIFQPFATHEKKSKRRKEITSAIPFCIVKDMMPTSR